MRTIQVTDRRTGETRQVPVTGTIVRIGKQQENDLVLDRTGVSRRHCELREVGGAWRVIDLNSRNGTFVNRERVQGERPIPEGAAVQVGEFTLTFDQDAKTEARAPAAVARGPAARTGPTRRVTPPHLKRRIHHRLLEEIDLKHTDMGEKPDHELRSHTQEVCARIVGTIRDEVPDWLDPQALIKEVVDEAVGLGPLEELLQDDAVTEIMVVGWDKVYVERDGKITLSPKQFMDNQQVVAVMRRILAPIGRRIDETTPLQDGRLADGSRVNAIIPPLALTGPALTIRKFSRNPYGVQDLIGFGTLNGDMAAFLELCVRHRMSILISGGTGSGKTTLLNVLAGYIPGADRIITIEDAAELQLPQDHIVSLESRPPSIEGRNAVPIRELVRNALRMRPDRIVVGECRGGEALDMLQAMNTGHDGSLTTLHANSPRDAISRLETLVLMAELDLPSRAIREQIASALHLIVHTARLVDGTRKITRVSAVTGLEGDTVTLQDVFGFDQQGFDEDGRVQGSFAPTGLVPDFVHALRQRGIEVDMSMFAKKDAAS